MGNCIFVANNPGSFNALFPLILAFVKNSVKSSCFIVDFGREKLIQNKIPFLFLDETYNYEKVQQILRDQKGSVLITGTSGLHTRFGKMERLFIKAAKSCGVYSIAIVDHWCYYRRRFSMDDGKTLDCLPDTICAIDSVSKQEMVDAGIPENLIKVTGSPYLEHLWDIKEKILAEHSCSRLREKLGFADNDHIITFISGNAYFENYRKILKGYDEIKVLNDLIMAAKKTSFSREIKIVIKYHPRDEKKALAELCRDDQITLIDYSGNNIYELLAVSDKIVGTENMLLIEARLLNLNCFSYQPTLEKVRQLPFNIKVINTFQELQNIIKLKTWCIKDTNDNLIPTKKNQAVNKIKQIIFNNLN